MNANVKKLGISRQVPGSRSNFFFNKFVSQLLFNGQDQADSDLIGKCLSRLDAVAIVTIIKPESEVIVMTRQKEIRISTATVAGGLLSLYAGFSFLSFGEVVSLTLRIWKRLFDRKG